MANKKAFAIFEGGGVKGIAHIGALKAIEEAGIEFVGVAGTSAGSIVASLIAVGYRSEELLAFDPNSPKGIFDVSLEGTFIDAAEALIARQCREDVDQLIAILTQEPSDWWTWKGFRERCGECMIKCIPLGLVEWWLSNAIARFTKTFSDRGIVSTELFGTWLNNVLVKKLQDRGCSNVPERLTFRYLKTHGGIPLKMVATNATRRVTMVYEADTTPDIPISEAVQASIAIPYLFRPRLRDGDFLVDGGIVSNYPVWIFDAEREKEHQFVPTLGFQLSLPESQSNKSIAQTPLQHFWSLVSISLFGDYSLERRGVRELHDFRVPVSLGVAQFDAKPEQIQAAAHQAKERVKNRLKEVAIIFPPPEEDMRQLLRLQCEKLLQALTLPATTHLRANVLLKTGADRLTLHYAYNMDESPELGLVFFRGTGGSGTCWEQRAPIAVNLNEAREQYKEKWKMNRLQQNRIRKTLNSLLCIPLFCRRILNDSMKNCINDDMQLTNTLEQAFLGVLSFDSDTPELYDHFVRQVESWNQTTDGLKSPFKLELLTNKLAQPVAEALRG